MKFPCRLLACVLDMFLLRSFPAKNLEPGMYKERIVPDRAFVPSAALQDNNCFIDCKSSSRTTFAKSILADIDYWEVRVLPFGTHC